MKIVLILFLSINAISCLQNGIRVDPLSTHANFIAVIWQHDFFGPRYLCSGSIITEFHIVTAGHCVHNFRNYDIDVTVGRIDLNNMMSVMVHNIYLHHNFEIVHNLKDPHTEYWLNDIAILNLANQLTWGPHVARISLSSMGWLDDTSSKCYIMGWTSYRNDYVNTMLTSMSLQWVDAHILGDNCRQIQTPLLTNEIAAFITTMPATLDDTDIGSPLVCNGRAIGIIVGVKEQTRSEATVLTLAPYKRFIQHIITGGITEIENGELHNVVTIRFSDQFRCGGFMAHSRYIVTVARCVNNVKITELSVVFTYVMVPGMNLRSERSSVESLKIHPLYSPTYNPNLKEYSIANDIAVLKLNSDLPWNPSIRFMDLPDLSQISVDKPCEILRWVPSASKGPASKILIKSSVKILNSETSGAMSFHLPKEKFVVSSFHALPVASENDIGNPIIFEENIIGMVFAVPGHPNPVTCLKMSPYQDFIRYVMNTI